MHNGCSESLQVTGIVTAKFHYTGPTGPDRTRTDFFCDPGLRETPLGPCGSPTKSVRVRAGPCWSVRVRAGPIGSGRARVVEFSLYRSIYQILLPGWLGSRVVSVLNSVAEQPGFKSQSRRCRVTVFGKVFTPLCLCSPSSKNCSSPLKGCDGNCRPDGK